MPRPSTELVLLHCLDSSLPAKYLVFEPNLTITGYEVWLGNQDKEKNAAEELLERFSSKLKEMKVKHWTVVCESANAGESIVNMADKEKASFVVMGTRGQGTLRRTIFGNVSDYVLHNAAVPVFVFRDQH